MDDLTAVATPAAKGKISAAEMERRRQIVRQADANNRIEGVFRGEETDGIVEAFVRGDIDVLQMSAQLGALPQPR